MNNSYFTLALQWQFLNGCQVQMLKKAMRTKLHADIPVNVIQLLKRITSFTHFPVPQFYVITTLE
jgi:hypothetical protein